MKEFNLQEYLANPSQKIMTRDGRKARIVCTDMKNKQPILALITEGNREDIRFYSQNGVWCNDFPNHKLDLVFAPAKKKGWINIFRCKTELYIGDVFETKEEDEKMGKLSKNYITTIKIEWEE